MQRLNSFNLAPAVVGGSFLRMHLSPFGLLLNGSPPRGLREDSFSMDSMEQRTPVVMVQLGTALRPPTCFSQIIYSCQEWVLAATNVVNLDRFKDERLQILFTHLSWLTVVGIGNPPAYQSPSEKGNELVVGCLCGGLGCWVTFKCVLHSSFLKACHWRRWSILRSCKVCGGEGMRFWLESSGVWEECWVARLPNDCLLLCGTCHPCLT